MKSAELIRAELSAFFNADEVEWKPQATSGDKALAIAYIDARCVAERLDDVMGVDGWQDEYRVLDHGSVECTLRLKILGEWVSKTDVGGESDQKDAGDKRKAAYSDALKRAAVKWGIGRYLYSLPQQWVPYNKDKKQFVSTPQLPARFLPGGKPAPKPAPKPEPKAEQKPAEPKTPVFEETPGCLSVDQQKWIYKHLSTVPDYSKAILKVFGFDRWGLVPVKLADMAGLVVKHKISRDVLLEITGGFILNQLTDKDIEAVANDIQRRFEARKAS